ncbi:MAG: hypothetical protein HS111_05750 [Kofleriaceae bacterium]|nr:hypothetical protein [Kofleriaceae bacterium]MCL4227851.1 hypothetical protein [Myxococcales bacterium]
MSRRALSITIGLLGLAGALAMMVGVGAVGARGVEVLVRTPLPLEGDTIVLEVVAPPSAAGGLERIEVKGVGDRDREGEVLASLRADGASHAARHDGARHAARLQDARTVRFPVPTWIAPGERLGLTVYVDYLTAWANHAGRPEVVREREVRRLALTVHTPMSRRWAQVGIAGRGLGLFVLWFLVVWGVAALHARGRGRNDDHGAALDGLGLLAGYGGGGVLGHGLVTRPLLAGLGVTSTVAAVLLTTAWLVLPLAWVWWRWRRRRPPPPDAELPRARVVAR